jgi:hypothetical protein
MEQLGLVQKDMIPYIGTKSKVSEVLNGKRSLTLAMMRSLNKDLGISAEVLLKKSGADFPDQIQDMEWAKFPLFEMAKRNWIPRLGDIREKAEELIRDFIEQAGGLETVPRPCFRQGKRGRYNSKMDLYALTAWCVRVVFTLTLHNKMRKLSLRFEMINKRHDFILCSGFHQGCSPRRNDNFLIFSPCRESRRKPDPVLPRDRSKALRLHPWRLGSDSLRLLQR